jgi:serine/threonine protein kinase
LVYYEDCKIIEEVERFEKKLYIFIFMEFYESGDLSKFLKEKFKQKEFLKEEVVLDFIIQITNGLNILHSKKIVHRG